MADPSGKSSRAKSIGHYILMKTIGEGTFGKVKLGTHILTGERVAVKVLEKERIVDIADVERVAREIHILKLIRQCRHIIQLYEIIETPRQLYLIMEYACGGELFDYIVEHGRAEEKDACKFLHQILAGVERVHAMNVVHRDLKPENLLLDDRQDIKIVDFGLSNTFQDEQLLQTACGSPCYAAPEMIAGHKYNPPLVDIWSCGVILFALVCGFLPFEDQNHTELYKKILSAEYEMPDFVSPEVASLIQGMLTTEPTKRMTLADIRRHVWYNQIPEASLRDREDYGSLDEDILDQLDSYGFPREYAAKCLQTNKHNHVTTTYYLIKEKQLRSQHAGAVNGVNLAIADIDATCHEEYACGPQLPVAAVAAVATPSRGSRAGEETSVGRRSSQRNWWPEEGAPPPPGEPGERPAEDLSPPSDSQQQQQPTIAAVGSSRSPRIVAAPAHHEQHEEFQVIGGGRGAAGQSHELHPATARSSSMQPPGSARVWSAASPSTRRAHSVRAYGTPRGAPPLSARGRSRPGSGDMVPPPFVGRVPSAASSRRHPFSMDPGAASWGGATDGYPDFPNDEFEGSVPPLSARWTTRSSSIRRPLGVPPAAWGAGRRTSRPPSSARGPMAEQAAAAGSVQVSCSAGRPPRQIIHEVMRTLSDTRISFRQVSNFVVRCQTQGVRFQVEVLQQDRGGGFAVRLTRATGDVWQYKEICGRLLASMTL
eukprot:TRINITY_DN19784_c0_g1_i2.p1 TRINITY_DN19784_c0_g1~~TRINITY_DN19784_c0_g1_i2.p1  ORF type:complete len:711 (-),score=139.88 TRINITY_DN19784_c0_g1_i2:106-2238(-)